MLCVYILCVFCGTFVDKLRAHFEMYTLETHRMKEREKNKLERNNIMYVRRWKAESKRSIKNERKKKKQQQQHTLTHNLVFVSFILFFLPFFSPFFVPSFYCCFSWTYVFCVVNIDAVSSQCVHCVYSFCCSVCLLCARRAFILFLPLSLSLVRIPFLPENIITNILFFFICIQIAFLYAYGIQWMCSSFCRHTTLLVALSKSARADNGAHKL